MDQLSLLGLDKKLARRVRELAEEEHVSLNDAALLLMRRGAGLPEPVPSQSTVGDALDRFIGRWSSDDEQNVLQNIASCETVDQALWK